MAFTPNFVDLVRNYTTTTGTGNFALGAAVNGFTSFASALQPGDSFYYSAIGVEKPAEREVGRGTLLVNGSISREPVTGPKTNFSNGTKTISLIAAAEWFTSVQAGSGATSGISVATTKAALASASTQSPVVLTESGCEGVFVFDPTNSSAAVAGDPRQAVHIAPASDPTGATGAWVRRYAGPKPASWFGAQADGGTDDAVALQAWLDSGGHLSLPAGEYFSSAMLILRRNAVIEGEGYGFDNREVEGTATLGYDEMPGSRIRFAPGIGGLDVQPQTAVTDPSGNLAATQEGAYNSVIRNLALIGAGTGASATGLYCRTFAHLENVHAYRFQGKGFDFSATTGVVAAGDPAAEYGNLSNSSLADCQAISNGSHGLHIRGYDANTLNIKSFNAQLNGGWGLLCEGIIGSTFDNCHFATNTLGAIKAVGQNTNTFIKPYLETGIGNNVEVGSYHCFFGADISAINGGPGAGTPACYAALNTLVNVLRFQNTWAPGSLPGEAALGYRWDGLYLQGRGSASDVSLINRSGGVAAAVPTNSTNFVVYGTAYANILQSRGTNQSWPGVGDGYFAIIPHSSLGMMFGGYGTTNDVTVVNRSGTTVMGVTGNSVNVTFAGALAVAGAITSAAGITSSGGGVGYSTGAGGTVTQATSKSTGVTLNKPSGQITTSAAALAANTTVSFTLTNSQIAASDVVVLNHVSGGTGGAYAVNGQCSAGSAVINLRNITAGSLSEAITIRFALIKAATA